MPLGGERADEENASYRIGYRVQNGIEVRTWNRKVSGLLWQVSFCTELSLHLECLL